MIHLLLCLCVEVHESTIAYEMAVKKDPKNEDLSVNLFFSYGRLLHYLLQTNVYVIC
jgi:hypothetical protein